MNMRQQESNLAIFYDENWYLDVEEYQHIRIYAWFRSDGSNIVDRLYVQVDNKDKVVYDNETKAKVCVHCRDFNYLEYLFITKEAAELLEISAEEVRKNCLLYLIPFNEES